MNEVPTFALQRAARALARGAVIAHPTEGVYGLACDPDNPDAIGRLLAIKRRDPAKGLILLAASWSQLVPYVAPLAAPVLERMRAQWPGPTTFIVPAAAGLDPLISGGRDTVAVRVTAHPLSRALCEAFGSPVISTSANKASQPALLRAHEVRRKLGPAVDFVLAGALGGLQGPTRICDARSGAVLRAG